MEHDIHTHLLNPVTPRTEVHSTSVDLSLASVRETRLATSDNPQTRSEERWSPRLTWVGVCGSNL